MSWRFTTKDIKIRKDEKAEIRPRAPQLKNTVHLSGFREEKLKLAHTGQKAHVLRMIEGQIVTEDVLEEVPWREEGRGGCLHRMTPIRRLR